jgi:hypothetical protein
LGSKWGLSLFLVQHLCCVTALKSEAKCHQRRKWQGYGLLQGVSYFLLKLVMLSKIWTEWADPYLIEERKYETDSQFPRLWLRSELKHGKNSSRLQPLLSWWACEQTSQKLSGNLKTILCSNLSCQRPIDTKLPQGMPWSSGSRFQGVIDALDSLAQVVISFFEKVYRHRRQSGFCPQQIPILRFYGNQNSRHRAGRPRATGPRCLWVRKAGDVWSKGMKNSLSLFLLRDFFIFLILYNSRATETQRTFTNTDGSEQ